MKTKSRHLTVFTAKCCSVLALATLALLTGCVVTSVYPYYHPKDVTFDPALLGVWAEADKTNADKETWTFEKLDARTYKLVVAENDKRTEFDTRLFKLKGESFLDCLPRERPDNAAPLHFLMRVDALSPTLVLRLLKYDWLTKLVEKNPKAIRHVVVPKKAGDSGEGGDLVLTGDTSELQKFIAQHLKNSEAWSEKVVLKKF